MLVLLGDEFLKWYEESFSLEQWQEMQAQLATIPSYVMTPWFQGVVMMLIVFVIGLIMTAVSSLVLQKSINYTNPQ